MKVKVFYLTAEVGANGPTIPNDETELNKFLGSGIEMSFALQSTFSHYGAFKTCITVWYEDIKIKSAKDAKILETQVYGVVWTPNKSINTRIQTAFLNHDIRGHS